MLASRPARHLGLCDAISVMVGIVVGAGIFESPPMVAANVPGPVSLLLVWALGGALALVGALCYAELAAAYPRSGGDYVYLSRAYGPWLGFLYGWTELTVIRSGSIAAMAFVFADYAARLLPLGSHAPAVYATALVVALSVVNAVGVRRGAAAQNALTACKIGGLLLIAAFGLLAPLEAEARPAPTAASGSLALALIFVLWTYGGWNESACVAAEVREPQRNIPRALLLGTGLITLVYVGINGIFLYGLGFERLQTSQAVAADLLAGALGAPGATLMALLVAVSAAGAVNGQIFTGARIGSALGGDHRLLSPLGAWSARFGTPATALAVQGGITLVLIAAFGSRDGFEALVKYTAAVFWLFFLLTGVALFVLRHRDRDHPRPYAVVGYPVTPLLFCASSAYMLHGALSSAPVESLWGGAIVLSGLPIYWLSSRTARSGGAVPEPAVAREPLA